MHSFVVTSWDFYKRQVFLTSLKTTHTLQSLQSRKCIKVIATWYLLWKKGGSPALLSTHTRLGFIV